MSLLARMAATARRWVTRSLPLNRALRRVLARAFTRRGYALPTRFRPAAVEAMEGRDMPGSLLSFFTLTGLDFLGTYGPRPVPPAGALESWLPAAPGPNRGGADESLDGAAHWLLPSDATSSVVWADRADADAGRRSGMDLGDLPWAPGGGPDSGGPSKISAPASPDGAAGGGGPNAGSDAQAAPAAFVVPASPLLPSAPMAMSPSDGSATPAPASADPVPQPPPAKEVGPLSPPAGSLKGGPTPGGPAPAFGPVAGDVIDVNKLLGDGLVGWQTFEHGGADPGRGTTTLEAGDLVLREGNSLLVGATRRITLSANPGTVQLAYTSVTFDPAAKGQVRDAFELALVDDKGRSAVQTFTAPDRDAYYNQTEGLATAFPAATVEEVNKVVKLDVSKLSPGGTATLVVRLVNPDSDTGSVVRIPGRHEAPTVTLTGATPISEGTKYTLGLAAGNLFQDTVTKWTIDWKDGSPVQTVTGNPPSVSHDYADDDPAPVHAVTAAVFTSAGQTATATRTVTVNNVAPTVTPAANQTVTVNKALTALQVAGFTDPGYTVAANGTAETFTASIDWGDGKLDAPAPGVTPGAAGVNTKGTVTGTHTYTATGTKTVTVTVADDDGGSTSKTFTVTVVSSSNPPTALAASFATTNEGTAGTFTGTFTDTDAGTPATYSGQVQWGDGSADTVVPAAAGTGSTNFKVTATHTYADNKTGGYPITFTVTDPTNNAASKAATATITNAAPTITGTAAAQVIGLNVPLTVQAAAFKDAGFTYAPAGTVETFTTTTIAWGDGVTDTVSPAVVQGAVGTPTSGTVTGTHAYAVAGAKTVTVTVRDDDGGTAATTFTVTVGGSAPVLGTPAAMNKSENVAVPFSMTFTDADAEPAAGIKAVITWGDGSGTTTVTPTLSGSTYTVASSHVYADNKTGNYPVSVTVTDKYGYAVTRTAAATVTNTPPTATAGAAQTTKFGQPLTFPLLTFTDPGFTFAPAGTVETFSVEVDWNDGTAKQTFAPTATQGSAGANTTGALTGTHTFATTKLAPYQVSAKVTDDDGGTSTVTVPVTVTGGETQVYDTFTVVTIDLTTFDQSASYRNELGFYLTAADGSVPDPNWPADATKRVLPGGVGAVGPAPTNKPAVGYAEAAVVSPSRQVAFARNTTLGRKFQVALDPNTRIAFYGVQDATTDFWLANNRPNVVSGTNVFFSIRAANPDFDNQAGLTTQKAEHFRTTDLADGKGSLRYSFEDLDGAGDHDFNDLEFTLRAETNTQTKAVKFFVGDSAVDRSYTYNAQATNVGSTALAAANTDVSGTASNPDGTRVWQIDRAGKAVYVYSADGTAAGAWTPAPRAGSPAFVSLTDVGTDGTDLWLVDAGNGTAGTRRVLLYRSAAGRTGGANVPADAEFPLDATNTAASGLAVGHYSPTQTRLWVTNAGVAANTNQVFVYDFDPTGNAGAGKMVVAGNWQLDVGNTDPGDIANDPALVSPSSDLWVVDRSDRQIYHYPNSKAWVDNTGTAKGYREAPLVYGLLGPTRPEGIADPPPAINVTVTAPLVPEGTLSAGDVVLVTGTATSSDKLPTAVTVNGTGVSVLDAGGQYFAPVTLHAGPNPVAVTAASADGTASQTVSTTVPGRTPDPREGIDFGGLADVTSALAPEYGRTSFHMGANVLYADLAARHVGSDAVRTPLLVAVHHLTQAGVVSNRTERLPAGSRQMPPGGVPPATGRGPTIASAGSRITAIAVACVSVFGNGETA